MIGIRPIWWFVVWPIWRWLRMAMGTLLTTVHLILLPSCYFRTAKQMLGHWILNGIQLISLHIGCKSRCENKNIHIGTNQLAQYSNLVRCRHWKSIDYLRRIVPFLLFDSILQDPHSITYTSAWWDSINLVSSHLVSRWLLEQYWMSHETLRMNEVTIWIMIFVFFCNSWYKYDQHVIWVRMSYNLTVVSVVNNRPLWIKD